MDLNSNHFDSLAIIQLWNMCWVPTLYQELTSGLTVVVKQDIIHAMQVYNIVKKTDIK